MQWQEAVQTERERELSEECLNIYCDHPYLQFCCTHCLEADGRFFKRKENAISSYTVCTAHMASS